MPPDEHRAPKSSLSQGLRLLQTRSNPGRAKRLLSREQDHAFPGLRLGRNLVLPCQSQRTKAFQSFPVGPERLRGVHQDGPCVLLERLNEESAG